ncbi:uncharacterized protein LOC131149630 [Malania oleifera]|uniref:uncharacterized protein LOC131149630 n=1 Tax=Malania oleifera TaxID=397392 RepID=UPI0025ADE7C3|nr:uncharacterized protein LOC131149630 [Malania oleifera]
MASKLLQIFPYEAENPLELSLREAFELLEPQLRPPFPLTIPSQSEYAQLNQAILHGILSEPHLAKIHVKHLHAIVTDGYSFFVNLLTKIAMELYPKLVDSVKVQLIWVTSEMVDVSACGIDGLLVSLLRLVALGDFRDGNLWLCFNLVSLFTAKWDCLLEEEPSVLASALYTFLRLLADHYHLSSNAKLEMLKRMEIEFCIRVLREQFHLCLRIGRDLVRLLQDVVHVPEFRVLWKDLVLNPGVFRSPGFSDISQLYCSRTSSHYFLLRITPEMETQLRFLLSHVKLGSQKRHQAWFARKFLYGPEKETLICDIVRFICCAHHPSNEIIQSDVIPRWAVIGWLLKCCRKNYVEANVKLALFYDWLFFDDRLDNIMNIEPAMLLMVNSIPKYIDMTHTLLEFLFLLVDNYDVERKNVICQGVSSAFSALVKKGVVSSLDVLASSDVLSPFLKDRLGRFLFGLRLGVPNETVAPQLPHHSMQTLSFPCASTAETQILLEGKLTVTTCAQNDKVGCKIVDASVSNNPDVSCGPVVVADESHIDSIENLIQNLGETYKRSNSAGLKILEKIMFSFANRDPSRQATDFICNPENFSCKIAKEFELNGYKLFTPLEILPDNPLFDDEIHSPTALIISNFIFSQQEWIQDMLLFWSKTGSPVGARLLSYASRLAYEANVSGYLGSMATENSYVKVFYTRMPFLKFHIDAYNSYMSGGRKDFAETIVSGSKVNEEFVSNLVDGAFAAYRCFLIYSMNLLHKKADTSLRKFLISDIMLCSQWKRNRLKFVFCSIFSHLSDLSVGAENVIQLLVSQLDHAEILGIQFEISLKKFSIFGENSENICNLIKTSVKWDYVQQNKLWGLIRSELVVSKVKVEKVILEIFYSGVLDPDVNSIAVGGCLTLCTSCAPSPELVGAIMFLPSNLFPDFAAAVLANWVVSNASMLFKSLTDFLEKLQNENGGSPMSLGGFMINESALLWLLNYLDGHGMKGIDILSKLSKDISVIKEKLGDSAVVMETG